MPHSRQRLPPTPIASSASISNPLRSSTMPISNPISTTITSRPSLTPRLISLRRPPALLPSRPPNPRLRLKAPQTCLLYTSSSWAACRNRLRNRILRKRLPLLSRRRRSRSLRRNRHLPLVLTISSQTGLEVCAVLSRVRRSRTGIPSTAPRHCILTSLPIARRSRPLRLASQLHLRQQLKARKQWLTPSAI